MLQELGICAKKLKFDFEVTFNFKNPSEIVVFDPWAFLGFFHCELGLRVRSAAEHPAKRARSEKPTQAQGRTSVFSTARKSENGFFFN